MKFTLDGVLAMFAILASGYTEFEAGTPVVIPEQDVEIGALKVALDLTITKMPAGTAATPLNLTDALNLLADVPLFIAGTAVELPPVVFDLAGVSVQIKFGFKKVA